MLGPLRTPGFHVPDTTFKPFPRWRPAIKSICRRHGVAWKEIIQSDRLPRVVDCRHHIWWTLRTKYGAALTQIGRRTGGFDHSSVLHGVRRWETIRFERNEQLAIKASDLVKKLHRAIAKHGDLPIVGGFGIADEAPPTAVIALDEDEGDAEASGQKAVAFVLEA